MIRILTVLLFTTSLLTGCGGSEESTSTPDTSTPDTSTPVADLEIAGAYTDNYDQDLSVTNTAWDTAAIVQYDNDANHLIMQNAADAQWSPSLFNRIAWLEREGDGSFWFCWEVLDKDTQDDALNAADEADATDPATSGCGGFPWSKATPTS